MGIKPRVSRRRLDNYAKKNVQSAKGGLASMLVRILPGTEVLSNVNAMSVGT